MRDMLSQLVTLPTLCESCRGAVTVHLDAPLGIHPISAEDFPEDTRRRKSAWTCPHCNVLNLGEFPGHLARVMKQPN